MIPRSASYAAKLMPTYGATPIAVGINPLYNALTPPSSRMTLIVIPHTVRSCFENIVVVCRTALAVAAADAGADVWYADDNVGFGEGVDCIFCFWKTGIEAVAIDNLDRTRSRGYVVQTDVIPANAPLISRVGVSSCLPP